MGEGKRENSSGPKKEKGKFPGTKKEKGKRPAHKHFDPIPLSNQTAGTHARTERNDFPVEQPQISDVRFNDFEYELPARTAKAEYPAV